MSQRGKHFETIWKVQQVSHFEWVYISYKYINKFLSLHIKYIVSVLFSVEYIQNVYHIITSFLNCSFKKNVPTIFVIGFVASVRLIEGFM